MVRYFNSRVTDQYVTIIKLAGYSINGNHGSSSSRGRVPAPVPLKPFSTIDYLISFLRKHQELGVKTPDEKVVEAKNKHLIGVQDGHLCALEEGLSLVRDYEQKPTKVPQVAQQRPSEYPRRNL